MQRPLLPQLYHEQHWMCLLPGQRSGKYAPNKHTTERLSKHIPCAFLAPTVQFAALQTPATSSNTLKKSGSLAMLVVNARRPVRKWQLCTVQHGPTSVVSDVLGGTRYKSSTVDCSVIGTILLLKQTKLSLCSCTVLPPSQNCCPFFRLRVSRISYLYFLSTKFPHVHAVSPACTARL